MEGVVRIAPRYDPRIVALVQELDDRRESMAETCRRVCAAAEVVGITRPSYVHLSRLIRELRELSEAERARRKVIRQAWGWAAGELMVGRVPDPAFVARRLDEAEHR
jgi:hypothetical protein